MTFGFEAASKFGEKQRNDVVMAEDTDDSAVESKDEKYANMTTSGRKFLDKMSKYRSQQTVIVETVEDLKQCDILLRCELNKLRLSTTKHMFDNFGGVLPGKAASDEVINVAFDKMKEWHVDVHKALLMIDSMNTSNNLLGHLGSDEQGKQRWQPHMLNLGKLMIEMGCHIARIMGDGENDPFYKKGAAICRIIEDGRRYHFTKNGREFGTGKGKEERIAEIVLEDYGMPIQRELSKIIDNCLGDCVKCGKPGQQFTRCARCEILEGASSDSDDSDSSSDDDDDDKTVPMSDDECENLWRS